MTLMSVLQDLADRLGMKRAPHRDADGRPRLVFLAIAGLVSLMLWIGLGWAMVRLGGWLTRLMG